MYKIGAFSRLVGISVKTLRYYHDLGLLVPDQVDDESGYRYYGEASYDKARKIQMLKNYHFTLSEIQEILDPRQLYLDLNNPRDLDACLKEKYDQLDGQIASLRKEQEKLLKAMEKKEVGYMCKTSEVLVKDVAPVLVATLRYKGRYDDMGRYIGDLFKAVKGAAAGPVIALYYDEDYMEEDADIEVCIPVKKSITAPGISTRTLEGGRFASVIHTGPYDQISVSYKVLMDYLLSHELPTEIISRNVYQKGPGMFLKGNPEKYETEILMELKKA